MNSLNFNPFPDLKTGNIILRALDLNDENEIFTLRSDEGVLEHLDTKPAQSLDEAREFIIKIKKGLQNNEWVYWAISIENNPKLIGTICLWNFSKDFFIAELGYSLLPEFQGKGIMRDTVITVLNYGIEKLKLKSIKAEVAPMNEPSVKILTKNGFQLEKEIGNIHIYSLTP